MNVQCACCKGFYCRGGVEEASPDHCPMRGDLPPFHDLYSQGGALDLLTRSASVEAQGYGRWTRLRESAEFAHRMGFRRIALAHCPDMDSEASKVAAYLETSGFQVFLPHPGLASDPVGQADLFQGEGVDLNLICGMCVAHEIQFLGRTRSPTVSLIARDLRLRHNPAAALYLNRSYLKTELFGHWPGKNRIPYQGMDGETLARFSCDSQPVKDGASSRLAEAMELAHALGVRHIGLSFCVGLREEAKTLDRILETNGFQVSSVCCKTGSVPKEEAGISDAEKVRPGTVEMVCNPLAQAELLNRDEVELAMVLGQCVGHDAATLLHLEAPAACIVAKDRVLAHNTVAALYG